jgi:acetylornithine deacetylase
VDPALQLLKRLVAVDSVNPSLVSGAAGEQAVARMIAAHLESIDLAVEVQEAAPGRPNVVGTLEGRAPGPSLMFCGHIDTVGVAGMTRPFDPKERDGRIYGRGSQDMKSGVAAMIDAARVIAASGGLDRGRLVIACVVDEEHGSIGAEALVTRWKADAAVVTEPTDLTVAVAHKGFEWVEIETEGRAAHGSRPREGKDAIRMMGRVLNALDALDRELQARPGHARLGTASLHASIIQGGRELSSYPDRCHLQMERRTLPGERAGVAGDEADALLSALRADPDFRASHKPMLARAPYEIAEDHPLPAAMLSAITRTGSKSSPDGLVGMSFWTDAAILGDAGIPSILFGPTGAGLHSVEEWVDAASVLLCRDALVELTREWCR